jgi:hypothetical protein
MPPRAGKNQQARSGWTRPGRGKGRERPGAVQYPPAGIGKGQLVALRRLQLIDIKGPEATPAVGAHAGHGASIDSELGRSHGRRVEGHL